MGERGETLVLRKNACSGGESSCVDEDLVVRKNGKNGTHHVESVPINGKKKNGEAAPESQTTAACSKTPQLYTWSEISKHNKPKDAWLVLEDKVYDISNWMFKHPGGKDVIASYAGQDATDPFNAFHPELQLSKKYLPAFYIGDLDKNDKPKEGESKEESRARPHFNEALVEDFRKVREEVKKQGLFKPNYWFYAGMLFHILALEALSYVLMLNFGTGWGIWLVCALLMTTAQAQTGWLQHDFGHLSVFSKSKWNHWLHMFTICALKSASAAWWNWRHFLHHAKPNTIFLDPDIKMNHVFVIGKELARRWGLKRRGIMPYSLQHYYWHLIGPPLLLPIYFHVENVLYALLHRKWWDLFWMTTFFVKIFALYGPLLGFWNAFWFYMFFRMIESHWFVYVTQMNHIPMHIDFDKKWDWPTLQNMTTCNVEQSLFNDWFTGHLNFQIEHHLFPTMPRHNYAKANVLVREMFKRNGVTMQTKSLGTAMADIVGSLKTSSDIWYEAYYGHSR